MSTLDVGTVDAIREIVEFIESFSEDCPEILSSGEAAALAKLKSLLGLEAAPYSAKVIIDPTKPKAGVATGRGMRGDSLRFAKGPVNPALKETQRTKATRLQMLQAFLRDGYQ